MRLNESAEWFVTINMGAYSNALRLIHRIMHVSEGTDGYDSEGPLKGGTSGSIQKLGQASRLQYKVPMKTTTIAKEPVIVVSHRKEDYGKPQ